MTDIVPPPSPVPLRPHKSRLRTLSTMDQLSLHSSNSSINSASPIDVHPTSPMDMLPDSIRSSSPSIMSPPVTPQKSKYRSRFKEHFNGTQTPIEEKPKTSKSLNTNTSNNSTHKTAAPRKMSKSNTSTNTMAADELNLPLDHLLTTTTAPAKRVQLTTSISTPLQLPTLGSTTTPKPTPRKYGSNGSILTSKSATTTSSSTTSLHKPTSNISYNRADIIIARLESWYTFLKSVTSWIEDTAKINLHSSRGYYQRAYPHLDDGCAISTTTTSSSDGNTTTVEQNVNQAMLTVQAGFQSLTMQIAAEQQEFSKSLERDHIPPLMKLRKEVKDKIHKLKNDPTLILDELLRRAEVTRSKMTHLNRCCKQADKTQGQVEMDPWLANLLVLRQLKREVDEENRLRLLMIPIQNDAKEFETRLINLVKPAIQYCYKVLAPGAWDGTADKDAAPFELLMDQIKPDHEWQQFAELHKKNLVNEKYPKKDYLKINYPNKFHPLVLTLLKGKMERKFGVRKQFTERNYILSQGGYLHQFSMDDKVSPEKTIYIPNTTIVPSIDIHQLSKETVFAEYGSHDTSNTFEICRPASNVLQRDKISLFRTSTREELISWCRLLLHIASGASINSLNIETDQETNLSNSSSTFDEFENQPSVSIVQSCTDSIMSGRKGSVNTVTLASTAPVTAPPPTISIPTKTPSIVSSPARSIRSVRTEESFNEPAAMTKTASFLRDNDLNSTEKTHTASSPTLISTVIAEEETNNSTDAESFVTARFSEKNMDTDEENDEDEEEFIDDYFSISQVAGESKYDSDNDAVSIASTSTAKGPTTTAAATTSNSPVTKSPSLASTTFDDAQSSLYFSSASAPNSPTASNRSSIVSVPDFQLFPEVISYVNVNGGADDHNTRLSAAEMYKATLKLTLEDDDGDDYDDSNNDNKKV